MDILKKAVQIEKEGEKIYRGFAEKADSKGLREIFQFLAGEEKKHRKIFEDMAVEKEVDVPDTGLITKVKDIFKKMSKNSKDVSMDNHEVKVYRKALEVEQKSIDYYTEILEKVREDRKDTLEKIIAEEKKHYQLIENIIEFAGRPQQWLDDAEWYQLEEY